MKFCRLQPHIRRSSRARVPVSSALRVQRSHRQVAGPHLLPLDHRRHGPPATSPQTPHKCSPSNMASTSNSRYAGREMACCPAGSEVRFRDSEWKKVFVLARFRNSLLILGIFLLYPTPRWRRSRLEASEIHVNRNGPFETVVDTRPRQSHPGVRQLARPHLHEEVTEPIRHTYHSMRF